MAKFHRNGGNEEFPRTQAGGNFHGSTICSGGIFHACLYLLENNIISTYYTTTPWAAKGRASLRTVCRRPVCDRRKFGLRIFFGSGTLGKIKKCHMNHLLKMLRWRGALDESPRPKKFPRKCVLLVVSPFLSSSSSPGPSGVNYVKYVRFISKVFARG